MSLQRLLGGSRTRRSAVIACAALVFGVLLGSTAAYGFDRSTSDVLLPNTRIGGVAVGGLTLDRAVDRLRGEIEDPLHVPISVRSDGFDRLTTPWDLGLRVDVPAAANRALESGRDGNLLRRVWRRITGTPRAYGLAPRLDRTEIEAFLGEAAERVRVEPRDASMDASGGWIHVTPARVGRELDLEAAERALIHAVRTGADSVELTTRAIRPAVDASAYATVVLVRAGENKLYLYKDGSVAKTYAVATGAPEFPTPTGTFKVINKRVNPKWVNPGSDWAKRLPSYIPPGPDNPLGSRALDLNVSGIRIHGTPDAGSIGYSVSHGCIRMQMSEAEDLFERVPVGTPVVIVKAGPPRLRSKAPAAPPAGPAPQAPAPSA